MLTVEKEEKNQELFKPAKKSEKMENSRPLTLPQNFEGAQGQEFPERESGESVNIPQNINVIKEEDSVRTEREVRPTSPPDEFSKEDSQDIKMKKEDDSVKIEKRDDGGVSANVNCGGVESSMNFKGDLNMTINSADLKINTENEKNESDNKPKPYSVIWISAPTRDNAVDVATLLLTEKLVTSVNILEGVTTMSLKEGNIATVTEVVVKMKTETSLVQEIIRVTDDHFKNKLSINDAEILSTTLKDGNLAYFQYVSENTKDSSLPTHLREELDNNLIQNSKQVELEKHVIPKNVEISGQFQLESNT
jgi:periplasmic divalent cation tolerance protein